MNYVGQHNGIKRILSGIQPSGIPHIGNYLGAIRNWVRLQDEFGCGDGDEVLCMVADLHSLTTCRDPEVLRDNIYTTAASLLACGIKPEKSILFKQSDVPAHSELAWYLECRTQMGRAQQMTQFKEKSAKCSQSSENQKLNQQTMTVGLLAYPCLMAADILLYQATHVPVGNDQRQHLELTRDIARNMNKLVPEDNPLFTVPQAYFPENSHAARVMSLQDGLKKMNKSDPNGFKANIYLNDPPDVLRKKIKRAKTDSIGHFSHHSDSRLRRAEIFNLLGLIAAIQDKDEVETRMAYDGCLSTIIKNDLTELMIQEIVPIGEEMTRLMSEKSYLDTVLKKGREAANEIAVPTLLRAKESLGLG